MRKLKWTIACLIFVTILLSHSGCGRDNPTDFSNDRNLNLVETPSALTPASAPTQLPIQTPEPKETPQPAQETNDEIPFLWLVTDPHGQTMYVFGTFHVGLPEFFPLPLELMRAFRRSDLVAMEMPPTAATLVDWDIQSALEDYMSEEQIQELRRQAMAIFVEYEGYLLEMIGLTLEDLHDFNLEALDSILNQMAGAKIGASQRYGMEPFFTRQAGYMHIPVRYIENYVEVLERLRDISAPLRIRQLELSLNRGISERAEIFKTQLEAWRRGDEQALLDLSVNLVFEGLGDDELIEELRYVLFTSRDPQMADMVSKFMAEGRKVFFMVGAGHLLVENSVIDLLVERGYEAVRIR